jgi:hypothetical protein
MAKTLYYSPRKLERHWLVFGMNLTTRASPSMTGPKCICGPASIIRASNSPLLATAADGSSSALCWTQVSCPTIMGRGCTSPALLSASPRTMSQDSAPSPTSTTFS